TVDSMTGQVATQVAEEFNRRLDITGVILTKLDGDTRGGACLSMKKVTGKPIKFCGVGEKPADIEPFYPDRMANRILGMGDVLSLIERAQEAVTEEQAKKMEKKMRENSFDLNDYIEQIDMISKMGGAKGVLAMMPGMGGMKINENDIDEAAMYKNKAIIQSMTERERKNPQILNYSRKMRIAKGSGTTIQQINKLLKGFEQSKAMIKQMKGGRRMPFKR
ncbi:MAG: signal recognition particle protein, partial [Clostridia bacterium]|nr:signal recognition particle protein [Clostridia bacterium]